MVIKVLQEIANPANGHTHTVGTGGPNPLKAIPFAAAAVATTTITTSGTDVAAAAVLKILLRRLLLAALLKERRAIVVGFLLRGIVLCIIGIRTA